jgi:hypothetical protein
MQGLMLVRIAHVWRLLGGEVFFDSYAR